MPQDYDEEPGEQSSGKTAPVNVATQNWKSGFALGKVAPMPDKNWKKTAGLMTHKDMPGRPPKEAKKPKPIPQMSEKKKERIRTEGSEWDFFKKIALERSTGGFVIAEDVEGKKKKIRLEDLSTVNFAHIEGKGMNKKDRLNPDNISIVTFKNHFFEHTGQIYKGPELPN